MLRHIGSSVMPIVIAHRGASGYRPEHTLAAYELGGAAGRGLHRARPRRDARRRARLPPRERDLRHHRRRRPARVRRPPGDEGDRRQGLRRLVHRGLHARRAQDAAGARADPRRCGRTTPRYDGALRDPDVPGGHRLARRGSASASTRRPSTPPTTARSGLPLEPRLVDALRRDGLDPRCSCSPSTPTACGAAAPTRACSCSARAPIDVAAIADYAQAIGPAKQLVDAELVASRPRGGPRGASLHVPARAALPAPTATPDLDGRAAPLLRAWGSTACSRTIPDVRSAAVRRCWDWR